MGTMGGKLFVGFEGFFADFSKVQKAKSKEEKKRN